MARVSHPKKSKPVSPKRPSRTPKRSTIKPRTLSESSESKRGVPGPLVDNSWHEKFLESLRQHGFVKRACLNAGIFQSLAYHHRSNQPEFAEEWEEAIEESIALLEMEVHDRAMKGVEIPIMRNGVRVGTVFKKSDYLLMALLKSRCARYRDRVEVTRNQDVGGTPKMEDKELEAYREQVRESLRGSP